MRFNMQMKEKAWNFINEGNKMLPSGPEFAESTIVHILEEGQAQASA